MSKKSGIAEAVDAVGSQGKLARQVGVSQQAIGKWLAQGYVPTRRVIEVEQITGVPRARLIKAELVDLLATGL